jgi:hypothetical protein
MTTKECKKCNRILPLEEFYKHRYTKDGYLNFCKECVKARISKHREQNIERIRAYDRERGKLPHRIEQNRQETQKRRQETGYGKIHTMLNRAVINGECAKSNICQVCGYKSERLEGHHFDYSKPLDVIWLCPSCHRQYHTGKSERAKTVKIIIDNMVKLQAI